MKPAPASFFLLGLFGFIISIYLTLEKFFDYTWGTAFSLVFLLIFLSAIISITPGKDIEYEFSINEKNNNNVISEKVLGIKKNKKDKIKK